jgi:hypothetical protein
MILSTEAAGHGSALYTTVFAVFGGFWTLVLIVLFVGVGALLERYGHDSKGRGHH